MVRSYWSGPPFSSFRCASPGAAWAVWHADDLAHWLFNFGAGRCRRLRTPVLMQNAILVEVKAPPAGLSEDLRIGIDRETARDAAHEKDVAVLFARGETERNQLGCRRARHAPGRR